MIRTWLRICSSSTGQSYIYLPHMALSFHQYGVLPEKIQSEKIASVAMDYIRKGQSWDALTSKLGHCELSNSVVRQVLLQFRQPVDAKRALGFFHWCAKSKSFNHNTSNYCIAILILVRAKLTRDARALLESVLLKNPNDHDLEVVSALLDSYRITDSAPLVFDLLVQSYSKLRMMDIAFDTCLYLDEHGFTLSIISYNMLIHVVQKSDRTDLVWKIYEHMIQKRTYPNEVTIRTMINALCKEGKLQEQLDTIDRIQGKRCSPSVVVNTSLVFRMIEEGRDEEGLILMKRMLQKNMILDTIFYSLVVYAKVKIHGVDAAREVFDEMLKRGFQANPFLCTQFIGAHCNEGRIDGAIRLMHEMENVGIKPYDEAFNRLIIGCALAGRVEEGLKFYKRILATGTLPSCAAFNAIAGNLSETGCTSLANSLLTDLMEKEFKPDETTYSHLIAGYAREDNIEEVMKLYYELEFRSIHPNELVFESLICCLCRSGKVDEAERYLKVMRGRSMEPSANICKALISSHQVKGSADLCNETAKS